MNRHDSCRDISVNRCKPLLINLEEHASSQIDALSEILITKARILFMRHSSSHVDRALKSVIMLIVCRYVGLVSYYMKLKSASKADTSFFLAILLSTSTHSSPCHDGMS